MYFVITISIILYKTWSILVHNFFLLGSIITVLVTTWDFIMRWNLLRLQMIFVEEFLHFLKNVTDTAAFPHNQKYRNLKTRRRNLRRAILNLSQYSWVSHHQTLSPFDYTNQTLFPFVLIGKYTVQKTGDKTASGQGVADNRQIAGSFGLTLACGLLPIQLIYRGKLAVPYHPDG